MTTPTREHHREPQDVRSGRLMALGALLALLVAGVVVTGLFATGAIDSGDGTAANSSGTVKIESAGASAFNARAVYAAAAPSVVDITAKVVTQASSAVPDPFAPPQAQEATQTGTGSVLDTDGRILTAEHVIAGARSISVEFQDGTSRPAKLLGKDSATDLAVLKVDATGLTLHPLALGSSRTLRIGDPIALIGDPFGYPRSLSTGVVSGLDRTIAAPNGFTVAHAIQTDGALNPGNSGGPLLDSRARLVGVADQIATGGTGTKSYTGVGFAVPVDVARSVLSDLERGVAPKHAYLGVSTNDVAAGALVRGVAAGGPAEAGGIKPGDVIVAIDGTRVTGANDLVAALAAHEPGDKVTVTVQRGSGRQQLDVTLAEQPRQASGG